MIEGKVQKGNKKAGKMGFPTANIKNTTKVLPGIYAGLVTVAKKEHDAVLYVGANNKDILEAHLLDYKGNLYGKTIKVEVLEKIRDDKHVTDTILLKEMIEKDCMDAWAILFERK